MGTLRVKGVIKVRAGKKLSSLRFHFFTIILGLIMIYPLLWLLSSSFKSNEEIFVNSYSLIPKNWDIVKNYSSGWKGVGGISFGTFMWNSVFVAVIGTVGGVLSSVLAAYAFARIKFFGSKFWFFCVMMTLMIPNQVMVVPQFIIFKKLGLINNIAALIIPWVFGGAFFIFLTVQFIRGLPIELDEAAEIDGCNKIQIFTKIIFPLVIPAVITSTIFSFYWIWQDFFQPLIFMSNPKHFTVSLALNLYLDPNSFNNYGGMLAMSVVSLVPVVIIFLIFQKQLVEGVATSGLKD
ncbi:MAG: carbohydrate ABC transporter permease [Clostridiaceae bacterium]|nr:carbohydrate ABC transporter permease [Clostridiaceae bacterium]